MSFLHHTVMSYSEHKPGLYPPTRWTSCFRGTIRAAFASFLMLALIHSSPAFAATPDLQAVLTGSRQRIQQLDYRATGRLTQTTADGKHTSLKFTAKAHWFPDGLRILFEIAGTASDKTSILLQMSPTGRVTIDTLAPGAKAPAALPFEHWNDSLMGTDFSYEDMVENYFFWKGQELLPAEKYGARDCVVLKSTPGSQDHSGYSSITSWIDQGILFPVHVVKTLRGTGQQKDFVYYGLRQVSGAWSASRVEAKQQGKTGSSILIIEGGSGKANLTKKDFALGSSSAQ